MTAVLGSRDNVVDDVVQHGQLIVLRLDCGLLSLNIDGDVVNASLLIVLASHDLLKAIKVLLRLEIQLVYLSLQFSLSENLDTVHPVREVLLASDRIGREV